MSFLDICFANLFQPRHSRIIFYLVFLYSELHTISNYASGSNDGSAKHYMEQKVNGKTGVLLTGLWTTRAGLTPLLKQFSLVACRGTKRHCLFSSLPGCLTVNKMERLFLQCFMAAYFKKIKITVLPPPLFLLLARHLFDALSQHHWSKNQDKLTTDDEDWLGNLSRKKAQKH